MIPGLAESARPARALPSRGPGGRRAAAPEHRHGLRPGRGQGAALHRHGVHRGHRPREDGPEPRATAASRWKIEVIRQICDGLGLRPPRRHRAPRHQARQHPRDHRGRGQDHGLRHRPPAVLDHDEERPRAGHRPLHGPRADRGPQGGPSGRHLLGGRHRLRADLVQEALRRRQPDGGDVQDHARASRSGGACRRPTSRPASRPSS